MKKTFVGLDLRTSWSPVRLANHYTKVSTVSETHRNAFSSLQSCSTDSSWINLIQLTWHKIGKTRMAPCLIGLYLTKWKWEHLLLQYRLLSSEPSGQFSSLLQACSTGMHQAVLWHRNPSCTLPWKLKLHSERKSKNISLLLFFFVWLSHFKYLRKSAWEVRSIVLLQK